MTDIHQTLTERGACYGDFKTGATLIQGLKGQLKLAPSWHQLGYDQKEALEMIMHKVGRILNGDPNYKDSWVDIAGYAQLIVNELE